MPGAPFAVIGVALALGGGVLVVDVGKPADRDLGGTDDAYNVVV